MVLNPQAKSIRENISRAKGYLGRSELVKGMRAMAEALRTMTSSQIFGRDKFEIETLAREVIANINQFPDVKKRAIDGIQYKKGGERNMLLILDSLANVIQADADRERLGLHNQAEKHRQLAMRKARDLLAAKDFLSAVRIFRSQTEVSPLDAGLNIEIGEMLVEFAYPKEAIEFLDAAIEYDPKSPRAYAGLVAAYRGIGDLKGAEKVYLNALKQFGAHPKTFLNLARLYMESRDWSRAYDAARQAQNLDPGLAEAAAILTQLESKFF